MKHLKKLAWCFLITMFFLTSCQEDRSLSDWDKDSKESLISGAKEFFETTISEAVTRGTLVQDKSWSPGEVVPEWREASIKRNEKYEYVFVPIFTQKHYVGRYRMIKKNGNRFSHVRVSQVLCIRRNVDGVYSAAYLTLMPSKAYYNAHKNKVASEFMKGSNFHNTFSGRVAYNDIISFRLLAVDKVDKGEFEWGISRKTANNKESFKESYQEMFKHTTILEVVATRAEGNYELDDFYFYACKDCGQSLDEGETCYCNNDNSFPGGGNEDIDYDEDNDNDNNNNDEDWLGGGGGGPSGGGGNNNSGNGNNNNNTPKSKLNPNIKIPNNLRTQGEGTKTCMPFSMYYALKLMGEKGGPYKLMDEFNNKFKINIERDGMYISTLNIYLNENFDTATFINYERAVDNGYLQILNIDSEGEFVSHIGPGGVENLIYTVTPHAVLLIGYNTNSNGVVDSYIVLDPLTGNKRTIAPWDIRENPPHSVSFKKK